LACDAKWVDNEGYSCKEYSNEKWCTPGGKHGSGWEDRWGRISDFANKGKDALQACCECGGGKVESVARSDLRADNTTTGMRELTGGEIVGIVVGSVLLILTIVLSVDLVRCHKASKAIVVA